MGRRVERGDATEARKPSTLKRLDHSEQAGETHVKRGHTRAALSAEGPLGRLITSATRTGRGEVRLPQRADCRAIQFGVNATTGTCRSPGGGRPRSEALVETANGSPRST